MIKKNTHKKLGVQRYGKKHIGIWKTSIAIDAYWDTPGIFFCLLLSLIQYYNIIHRS